MLIPSKFTRLEESTIFKMRHIMIDRPESEDLHELYLRTKDKFYDASEFLHALDVLYVLELITFDADKGTIEYA